MKLYYAPYSSNSRKVRMAASMLGIELDLVPVDLVRGAQRQPEFLERNPMGRVPVLEDGDFVLTESHAIMAYLADTKPGNSLYPADARSRGNVNRWLFWASSHWAPSIAGLAFEHFLKKLLRLGDPDPLHVERLQSAFAEAGQVLDAHLGSPGRTWLAGTTLTIADIAVAVPLMVRQRAKLPLDPFANVHAWVQRLSGLDAWRETLPPELPPG